MSALNDLDVDFSAEVAKALTCLHDWSVENPNESEALMAGSFVFGWYAMPDCLRSSGTRFVAKSAMLAALAAYYHHLGVTKDDVLDASAEVKDLWVRQLGHLHPAAQVAIAASGTVAVLKLNSVVERFILNRGERRKRAGKRLPHVRQGLALGLLAGGCTYVAARKF
ncbi:MAG: hypothetical protein Q4E01_00030 [Actinomycetaceae bacterium]|nr:hypothetical protein [Actinomycetaceae bacterium]